MAKSMRIRKDDHVVDHRPARTAARPAGCSAPSRSSGSVYVEGLNIVKRHQRPRSVKDTQKGGEVGGIIEKEGPIHVSNVMLLDPTDNKPTRVGMRARRRRQARALREAHREGDRLGTDGSSRPQPDTAGGAAAAAARALPRGGRAGADRAVRLLDARCRPRAWRRSPSTWASARRSRTRKMLEAATEQLATIAGQRPSVRRARSRSPPSRSARGCRSASR